jgi:hypothetical protein
MINSICPRGTAFLAAAQGMSIFPVYGENSFHPALCQNTYQEETQ